MTPRFRHHHLRAKDVDRNRAAEIITAALEDGQLTPTDHAERISRALTATSLGDLEKLTQDLHDVERVAPPVRPSVRQRRVRRTAVALGACLLVGAGVLAVTDSEDDTPAAGPAQSEPPPAHDPEPAPDPDPEPEPDPVAEPEPEPTYSFTTKGIKTFIDLYTEELGEPKELAFGFAPHQVVIYRPMDASSTSRTEGMVNRWFFRDGRFLDDGPERPRSPMGTELVDLRELDVSAMMRNLSEVKRSVGDQNGSGKFTTLGATVLHDRGRAEVHVVAGLGGTCHSVTTTLAGEVLEPDSFTCPS